MYRNIMYRNLRTKKNKKGFEVGKIFIFLLALLIMSFILFYSYKWINDILHKKDIADYNLFKDDFNNKINTGVQSIDQNYVQVSVPSYVEKVCIADFENIESESKCPPPTDFDPLFCNAVVKGVQNVFVIPEKSGVGIPIKNELISLGNEKVICFNTGTGYLEMKITGASKKALIEIPEEV